MTRDEWARELIRKLAGGFMSGVYRQEASDYLQGKEPPVKWEPKERS